MAGDILSTISQCVYSLLLQPFSSGVHKYSHRAKKGGGIGTSQIPLNNIDCKANWLKFIDQWCDKDHPKTWSHQSHHASVPSLTLSIIIDPADENSGFFRVILFYLARLYMCIIDLERPGWVIISHSITIAVRNAWWFLGWPWVTTWNIKIGHWNRGLGSILKNYLFYGP